MGHCGPGAQKARLEVQIEHGIPIFVGHSGHGNVAGAACAIDEDVEPAEGVDSAGDHGVDLSAFGDIRAVRDCPAPFGRDRLRDCPRRVDVPVVDDYRCPLPRQATDDGPSYVASAARDQCHSIVQFHRPLLGSNFPIARRKSILP